MGTLNTN